MQRLERELDDVTIASPPVGGGGATTSAAAVELGNYGDDILPGAAENMGSGNTIDNATLGRVSTVIESSVDD